MTERILHIAALHLLLQKGILAESPDKASIDEAAALLKEAGEHGFTYVPCEDVPKLAVLDNNRFPGIFVAGRVVPENIVNRLSVPSLAVVGTRNISYYGKDLVRWRLEKHPKDVPVVTAFGLGVANATILEAFRKDLPQITVTGTGPGDCYPYSMRGVLDKIINARGCLVVTPFFPHTEPTPMNFLLRNHIVAALADETFLAETRINGGAIVTARLAYDYGRIVTAAPGRISDTASAGANQLIRARIAEMWLPWDKKPEDQ